MNKKMVINGIKKSRVLYKEYYHKKEADRYLKNFPSIKLSPSYKKAIDAYWKKYGVRVSGKWHQVFIASSGMEDVRFIDIALFYSKIIGRLNFQKFSAAYDDKCRYDILFPDIKQPGTIVKNINGYFFDENNCLISKEYAKKKVAEVERCIVKPSIGTSGGKGIRVLKKQNEETYINDMIQIMNQKNYIVQHFIKQNVVLNNLNPDSVNTVRILSLLWNGEVYIIASLLRIGEKGKEFVTCSTECRGIKKDGKLDTISHDVNLYVKKDLEDNIVLPNYSEIIDYIKAKHKELSYFSIIGWDFAIDVNDNPILIEVNTNWPGIETKQCLYGPLFGELTDEVMEYVFFDKQAVLDGVSIAL